MKSLESIDVRCRQGATRFAKCFLCFSSGTTVGPSAAIPRQCLSQRHIIHFGFPFTEGAGLATMGFVRWPTCILFFGGSPALLATLLSLITTTRTILTACRVTKRILKHSLRPYRPYHMKCVGIWTSLKISTKRAGTCYTNSAGFISLMNRP
jgi:hypothetical protein